LSLDTFNSLLGVEIKDEPDPDPEDEVIAEEIEVETSEVSEEKDEEETQEDDAQGLEALPKDTKGIKAKTKDGKDVTLPEDLVVPWKVDGEVKDIPLKDFMGIVAGELTVNQRLGKLASFKEELKRERDAFIDRKKEDHLEMEKILHLCHQGQPEAALCFLAERAGKSPVSLYKTLLSNVDKAYQVFKDWPTEKIENHFLQLELKHNQEQQDKKEAAEGKKREAHGFLADCEDQRKQNGLSEDEFASSANYLAEKGDFKGLSRSDRLDRTLEQALYVKHLGMVDAAVRKIDPKLLNNENLLREVLRTTNPHDWSVEEIVEVIREVLKGETSRIATNLSKKAPAASRAASEKKSEAKQKKTVRSVSDLGRAFGLVG